MYGYIYMIVNKINGKTYIGQRKFNGEWYEDKYMGSGKRLKCTKKHYGIENFEKFLVQYVKTKEEADKQEKFWISEYRKRGKAEYNIANGGEGGCVLGDHAWNSGKKMSTEWKEKHPNAKYWTGKKHPEEYKKMMRDSCKDGNSTSFKKGHKSQNKGKKYYKNPKSDECGLFLENQQPFGWVLGRYTPWQGKEKQ